MPGCARLGRRAARRKRDVIPHPVHHRHRDDGQECQRDKRVEHAGNKRELEQVERDVSTEQWIASIERNAVQSLQYGHPRGRGRYRGEKSQHRSRGQKEPRECSREVDRHSVSTIHVEDRESSSGSPRYSDIAVEIRERDDPADDEETDAPYERRRENGTKAYFAVPQPIGRKAREPRYYDERNEDAGEDPQYGATECTRQRWQTPRARTLEWSCHVRIKMQLGARVGYLLTAITYDRDPSAQN